MQVVHDTRWGMAYNLATHPGILAAEPTFALESALNTLTDCFESLSDMDSDMDTYDSRVAQRCKLAGRLDRLVQLAVPVLNLQPLSTGYSSARHSDTILKMATQSLRDGSSQALFPAYFNSVPIAAAIARSAHHRNRDNHQVRVRVVISAVMHVAGKKETECIRAGFRARC